MEEPIESPLAGTQRIFALTQVPQQTDQQVTLIPQPTSSPNDPLNWPIWRKYWHASLVLFITGLTAATSNSAGTAGNGMNAELGISWGAINTAAGVLFVGIGYCTLLLSPMPWLYGRRSIYMICLLFSIIGSIWFARVQTTEDNVWNQLFVGASESCAEATVQLSLSDIFFQHQRGSVLGLYILATSVGTYLGPLISGFITDNDSLGWRWVGWFAVIISAATLLLFYFGLEETSFDRKAVLNGVGVAPTNPHLDVEGEKKFGNPQETLVVNDQTGDPEGRQEKKKTYWQRIALVTPAPTIQGYGFKQFWKRLFLILRVFSFPAVLYSGLQWGAQDAWLTFYLTIEEDNWYGPPWNYSDAADAIMNVPCLIGAVIGCIYGGWFSDVFVRWMAKRNNGIAEAEHRLWLMFPAAIFSPLGLILFGIGSDRGWSWPWPYVGLGFIGFGWGCAGDLSMAYLMDAYPEMVLEGMVGVAVVNNTLACIFTFVTGKQYLNVSPLNLLTLDHRGLACSAKHHSGIC